MENVELLAPTRAARSSRWGWILLVGSLAVVGAVYGTFKLYQFADPENFDPSPLPREVHNAPFITTPPEVVDKMIEMGQITDQDLVYDLGCGDGRIVIGAALQRGCRGVGFDYDPQRVAEATENVKKHNVESLVTIQQQDVFQLDLTPANVIVMYLLPGMLQKLIPSFDRCPPGTRIVSHDFEIEGVQAEKTEVVSVEPNQDHRVCLYVTPLKKLPEKPKWKRKW